MERIAEILGLRNAKKYPGPQPSALFRSDIGKIFKEDFVVSFKADGERFALVVDGEDVFASNIKHCVPDLGIRFPRKARIPGKCSVFDCEFVSPKSFLVFDAMMVMGEDVRGLDLRTRLKKARWVVDGVSAQDKCPYAIAMKPVFPARDFESVWAAHGAQSDGLVFTKVCHSFKVGTDTDILKWKPRELNTVDFVMKMMLRMPRNEDEAKHEFALIPGTFRVLEFHVVADAGGLKPVFTFPAHAFGEEYSPGIWECAWDGSKWLPQRQRNDKIAPNSEWVYRRNCKVIKENISIETIKQIMLNKL